MKIEKHVDEAIVNKLFRPARVQRTIMDFCDDRSSRVWKLVFADGEYTSIRSAQTSYHNTIKRMGLHSIVARVLNGELYLIKLEDCHVQPTI